MILPVLGGGYGLLFYDGDSDKTLSYYQKELSEHLNEIGHIRMLGMKNTRDAAVEAVGDEGRDFKCFVYTLVWAVTESPLLASRSVAEFRYNIPII